MSHFLYRTGLPSKENGAPTRRHMASPPRWGWEGVVRGYEACAMLRPTRSQFSALPAAEQAAVTRACAPGLRALGYME